MKNKSFKENVLTRIAANQTRLAEGGEPRRTRINANDWQEDSRPLALDSRKFALKVYLLLVSLIGLTGCVTSRNRSVDIPVANVAAVYEPPNTRVITIEIIAVIFILALVLYLVLEKLLRKKPKGQQ